MRTPNDTDRKLDDARRFTQGKRFDHASPKEVLSFLESRNLEVLQVPPQQCRVVPHGTQLIVQHVNGKVREWPMRETFFEKLLRWYHIPSQPLHRMGLDSVVPFLNGILGLIRDSVNLTVENGEALTITSHKYSPIKDLAVLNQCADYGLIGVTRTDFLTRSYFEERIKAEPIPGDSCGFGFNVLNSETGFMALRVCPFILRYTCSNGAVAAFGLGDAAAGLVHYDVSQEAMQQYFRRALLATDETLPRLARLLTESTKRPVPARSDLEHDLNAILGFPKGRRYLDDFDEAVTPGLYGLFNHITAGAKKFNPSIRLRLEEYAGSLLRPTHPFQKEPQWPDAN